MAKSGRNAKTPQTKSRLAVRKRAEVHRTDVKMLQQFTRQYAGMAFERLINRLTKVRQEIRALDAKGIVSRPLAAEREALTRIQNARLAFVMKYMGFTASRLNGRLSEIRAFLAQKPAEATHYALIVERQALWELLAEPKPGPIRGK